MSKFAKISIGIGFSLLVIAIAGILFSRHLVTKSFPITDGVLIVEGLHASVDVYRDEYGVPHINARDEHDLMFATGYVHAQDRLWQMDLMRRSGEGRLSELLGSSTTEIDALFRTIDLRGVAEKMKRQMHPQSLQILEDYRDGVNAFIVTHKGSYPVEFDMLNYEPELWRVEHSLLIARLIAWDLNLAWWTDLTYGEIAAKVPSEKMQEIFPTFPDSIPVTVPSALTKKALSSIRDMLNVGRSYRDLFGLGSLEAGSNGWVVDSSKSLSGKPLLANDPHLAMPAPSRWYEVHLSAPGWNVAGVSVPGAPVIIIGHNDHHAWGLTNAMLDDADFYVERIDSTNPSYYLFQKSSQRFDERNEVIHIRGGDSLTLNVRSTRHGPIINDVHPMHHHQDSASHQYPIALRWTGLDVSDEIHGFSLMNRATTIGEFEEGLKEIEVPGQSVVYADTNGNIAYWTTGRVPIRGKGNPMLPMPGWTGDAEWNGFIPFDRLPKRINPPEGMIVCANQKIADNTFPYYLSTLWEPTSRVQRIRQLLHSSEKFTADDFKQFQQDIMSLYARDILGHLMNAFEGYENNDREISDALNYLHNWDFRFTQNDIAATIFNSFFVHLLHNIYADEMGEDIFRDFVFFGAIPYRVTGQLLAADSSAWFDDVKTARVETKDEILRKSLSDGVRELQGALGTEMKTWQWGNLHTVTFKHPFGSRKPLETVFNIGPFPASGGGTTINKSEYKFMFPYTTSVGPSMRLVVDLARPLTAWTVITSGQSGQPFHTHYDDQASLWLNGGYHQVTLDWNEIRRSRWEHLGLRP